jgi:heptosyltransferase I
LIEEFAGQGMDVILTGAPSDSAANDRLLSALSPRTRHFVRNAAGTNLKETMMTLADARLVVSVDTGVMHIAAALGVPLVALHGPTSAKRWGPMSERAVAIDSPLPGCGYISLGWEHRFQPPACMECISYETVRDACTTMLLKWPSAVRAELSGSGSVRVLNQTS